jgi:hypothetical protein
MGLEMSPSFKFQIQEFDILSQPFLLFLLAAFAITDVSLVEPNHRFNTTIKYFSQV